MLLMKWRCGRPRVPTDPVLLCVVLGGHGRSKLSHFPKVELYLSQNSVSTVILNAGEPKEGQHHDGKKHLEPKTHSDCGIAYLGFRKDVDMGRL